VKRVNLDWIGTEWHTLQVMRGEPIGVDINCLTSVSATRKLVQAELIEAECTTSLDLLRDKHGAVIRNHGHCLTVTASPQIHWRGITRQDIRIKWGFGRQPRMFFSTYESINKGVEDVVSVFIKLDYPQTLKELWKDPCCALPQASQYN
jgi:hypothetical protein